MKITIDKNSGFCFGVVSAVRRVEEILEHQDTLYCLGDIVHNSKEVERLANLGLVTISHEQFKKLKNTTVLIRAHGEPPETYQTAKRNNVKIIDATCPVVLRLQKKVKKGADIATKDQGQSVIYGKKNHAEVVGLLGQTDGKGIVISNHKDLDNIDYTRPIHLYSQTTMNLQEYAEIIYEIRNRIQKAGKDIDQNLITQDSICRQVSGRDKKLRDFALKNDVVIFVSGKKSSNGKALYKVCKQMNEQSYFISDMDDLDASMIENAQSVGICGATSTPLWLMEEVKAGIQKMAFKIKN